MITLLSLGAWLIGAVLFSRPVYGHLRARGIDRYKSRYRTLSWENDGRGETTFATICLSLLWPGLWAIPLALLAHRWMTGSKIRSKSEIEDEKHAMQDKIHRLEAELGLNEPKSGDAHSMAYYMRQGYSAADACRRAAEYADWD